MQNPTRRLFRTLGLGWLSFVGVGAALNYAVSATDVVVIIDRSYCPAAQWQQSVVQPYTDLYEKVEQKQVQIQQVIYITDLNQTTLQNPPMPGDLGNPFGQAPSPESLEQVKQQFPDAVILQCGG